MYGQRIDACYQNVPRHTPVQVQPALNVEINVGGILAVTEEKGVMGLLLFMVHKIKSNQIPSK